MVHSKSVDTDMTIMRYSLREVGLAMCHSTGSIGDTPIDPFYLEIKIPFIPLSLYPFIPLSLYPFILDFATHHHSYF